MPATVEVLYFRTRNRPDGSPAEEQREGTWGARVKNECVEVTYITDCTELHEAMEAVAGFVLESGGGVSSPP